MTRADRRRMRRHADRVAAFLAASCLHRDGAGRLRCIDDPAAITTLRRGFAEMIRNDCRPVVRRLTEADARALPGWRATPPGATWWAAFGLDVERRGAWVSEWILAAGLTEAEAADAVEVHMLGRLAALCNAPGFPAEARA